MEKIPKQYTKVTFMLRIPKTVHVQKIKTFHQNVWLFSTYPKLFTTKIPNIFYDTFIATRASASASAGIAVSGASCLCSQIYFSKPACMHGIGSILWSLHRLVLAVFLLVPLKTGAYIKFMTTTLYTRVSTYERLYRSLWSPSSTQNFQCVR